VFGAVASLLLCVLWMGVPIIGMLLYLEQSILIRVYLLQVRASYSQHACL
jgi:hypothetical protein